MAASCNPTAGSSRFSPDTDGGVASPTGQPTFLAFSNVSASMTGYANEKGKAGVLVADGDPVCLPDLGSASGVNGMAYTVSDDGSTIAGQVALANGDPVAVLWSCG